MKKKLALFLCLAMLAAIFPASALSASAETCGDYEYDVINEAAKTCMIIKYHGTGGDVVIPSTLNGYKVTSIGGLAFYGCASLESVTIPDSVTSIGYRAFYGCASLESVTIPDSVTSIGYRAFYGCTSLASVTIPDSVTSIDYGAFDGCTSLASVTIPDSVTSIDMFAFEGCSSLIDVYYAGSEEQWKAIGISSFNDPLLNAEIHFNYVPAFEKGDATEDGTVDNVDAAAVLRYDASIIDEADISAKLADVNGDGEIDNLDSAIILQYDAGLIDKL